MILAMVSCSYKNDSLSYEDVQLADSLKRDTIISSLGNDIIFGFEFGMSVDSFVGQSSRLKEYTMDSKGVNRIGNFDISENFRSNEGVKDKYLPYFDIGRNDSLYVRAGYLCIYSFFHKGRLIKFSLHETVRVCERDFTKVEGIVSNIEETLCKKYYKPNKRYDFRTYPFLANKSYHPVVSYWSTPDRIIEIRIGMSEFSNRLKWDDFTVDIVLSFIDKAMWENAYRDIRAAQRAVESVEDSVRETDDSKILNKM